MEKENKLFKFLTTDIKLINTYLLVGIVLITLVLVGSASFALFSYEKTSNNLIRITAITDN